MPTWDDEQASRVDRLEVPQPWRSTIDASLELIDDLERRIAEINRELETGGADHPYVPLLLTAPGIGWVLAFTTLIVPRLDRQDLIPKRLGLRRHERQHAHLPQLDNSLTSRRFSSSGRTESESGAATISGKVPNRS